VNHIENICPICNESATMTAKCSLRQSFCESGHGWYHCPTHNNVKFVGQADQMLSSFQCICFPEPPTNATCLMIPVPAQNDEEVIFHTAA
jgi:hypothetical protein